MQTRNIEQKNNSVKWIAITIVSVLFLIFFIGTILIAKNKNKPITADGNAQFATARHVKSIPNPSTDATDSAEKSKSITLIEYGDLQCPACKAYYPIVKELVNAYPGQLKLVFKQFPLLSIHPNALGAAIASEASGKQGKFFEFVDIAYEKQDEWAGLPNPDDKFISYAKALGLNLDQFKKDLKDEDIKKAIESEREEGIKNGVTGTPSFFLEGERIVNPADVDAFKALVDAKLKNGEAKSQAPKAPTAIPTQTSAPGKLQLQQ